MLLRSSQLKTAQDIVKAIKGLAFVLPLIALLLFVLAVWLADGWRRVALRTTGWCLVGDRPARRARAPRDQQLRRQLAREGPREQARRAARLRDRHLAAVRPRDRDDHLRPGGRGGRLARRAHAAGPRGAPRAGAVAARARAVRLRGGGPGAAARGRLGAVSLDARGASGDRLRDSARARHPYFARDDRPGIPRRAARGFRARDSRLV